MNDKELFSPILQKDEEIIKTFKPNKKRYVLVSGLFSSIFQILLLALGIIMAVAGFSGNVLNEDGTVDYGFGWFGVVIVVLFVIFILITWISLAVSHKKTIYAYTNKRILIRRGFIGVDYATLDFDMIGGLMVNVGLLDKLIKKNGGTGTITFGSAASPVINTGNAGGVTPFTWKNIDDPYGVYREIKEVIDNSKAK